MELDTETARRYIGGQLEVQNPGEGYLYRGEIADASVENNEFRVRLAWNAKGEGFPPLQERWVKSEILDYSASLEIYAVSDIGDGRICLNSSIVGETTILFPSDGSRLDPSKIEPRKYTQI